MSAAGSQRSAIEAGPLWQGTRAMLMQAGLWAQYICIWDINNGRRYARRYIWEQRDGRFPGRGRSLRRLDLGRSSQLKRAVHRRRERKPSSFTARFHML